MGDNKREVGELAPERRSIALMPQRWRLFPHWTARRNLNFAAKLGGAERPSRSLNLERLAERLEVAPLLDRPVRALSGGETQRIALLQTLLSPAQVLLLDEPLSAVEAALQSTALDLLQGESATNHRICLIAVHHPTMGYALQGTLFLEKGFLLKSAPATEPIAIESTI
jgi:ABC-type sugar transport system ATPase subunit